MRRRVWPRKRRSFWAWSFHGAFFKQLVSLCPMWPHLVHFIILTSVQFRASWPRWLHLKQIFSVHSKESWVFLPHRMQEACRVSFGQSCYLCPICLQLWHFIVGFSSAQYRWPFWFFKLLKVSSSSPSSSACWSASLFNESSSSSSSSSSFFCLSLIPS